jgi:hypothetical protein
VTVKCVEYVMHMSGVGEIWELEFEGDYLYRVRWPKYGFRYHLPKCDYVRCTAIGERIPRAI